MYLIGKLLMRYDFKLFQLILNPMEIMCLIQESMGNAQFGCLKLIERMLAVAMNGIGTCNNMMVKHSGAGPLWDTGTQ